MKLILVLFGLLFFFNLAYSAEPWTCGTLENTGPGGTCPDCLKACVRPGGLGFELKLVAGALPSDTCILSGEVVVDDAPGAQVVLDPMPIRPHQVLMLNDIPVTPSGNEVYVAGTVVLATCD